MRLMLLRHAKSEKAEPGLRDHERTLNARGRSETPIIGAYMARHGLIPDRVIVSTARRTRETWERLAPAFSPAPPVTFEERLYDSVPETILAIVERPNNTTPGPRYCLGGPLSSVVRLADVA